MLYLVCVISINKICFCSKTVMEVMMFVYMATQCMLISQQGRIPFFPVTANCRRAVLLLLTYVSTF